PPDRGRLERRAVPFEHAGAAGGRQAQRRDVVLDRDGRTSERTWARVAQGVRIRQRDEGVQPLGPLLRRPDPLEGFAGVEGGRGGRGRRHSPAPSAWMPGGGGTRKNPSFQAGASAPGSPTDSRPSVSSAARVDAGGSAPDGAAATGSRSSSASAST